MAKKIGGFLGLLAGFIVWNMVGGIGGLLLAVFVVVPLVSFPLIAIFSAIGGRNHDDTNKKCPQCAEDIKFDAKFCHYCKYQFDEEEIKAIEVATQKKQIQKNQKSTRFSGLVLIVIGLCFGALLTLMYSSDAKIMSFTAFSVFLFLIGIAPFFLGVFLLRKASKVQL